MKQSMLWALCAALGLTATGAYAASAGTPTQPACLQTSMSLETPNNAWYTNASINVVNNCSSDVDLANAVVSFASNSTNMSSVWTWPFASSNTTFTNGTASFTLVNQGDQYSTTKIAPGKSIALNFGITLTGTPFNLAAAQQSLEVIPNGTPIASNGEIDIVVNPAGVQGITAAEAINITSGTTYNNSVNNSNWSAQSTYKVTGLSYGTYNVSPAALDGYTAIATPSSVSVNSTTPQIVTITYVVKAATCTVSVTLPAAPLSNIKSNVAVTLNDQTTKQTYNKTINWNQTAQFTDLPAGDVVSVSVPTFTNGPEIATPNAIAPVTVVKNQTTNVAVNYQVAAQTTTPVSFTVTGLTGAAGSLTLVDTYGASYGPFPLNNGTVTQQLPANDSFTPSATAQGLVASFNPQTFNTTSTGANVSVSFAAAPVGGKQLGAYWAGWMGYQYDLSNTYGAIPLTQIYMAFANYSNGEIDTSASGYISKIPAEKSQIWPSYQNWTTYAYKHKNAQMILSVGGATYSAIWNNLYSAAKNDPNQANPAAVQAMADSIVTTLNTDFPVYAPAGSDPSVAYAINGAAGSQGPQYGQSQLLGTVQMGGVDLDVEVADAATMNALTPYLIILAEDIHKAAPNKAVTFATFSTAADPANACTVPGSPHCGEARNLIQGINNNADQTLKNVVTYNVMAYDAGSDFVIGANPGYQTALQNYATIVGNPNKVILGLDLQTQWGTPYFEETCAQMSTQAQWAYQHPAVTGGTFLWEIGDDSHPCKALPALQGMESAMGQ